MEVRSLCTIWMWRATSPTSVCTKYRSAAAQCAPISSSLIPGMCRAMSSYSHFLLVVPGRAQPSLSRCPAARQVVRCPRSCSTGPRRWPGVAERMHVKVTQVRRSSPFGAKAAAVLGSSRPSARIVPSLMIFAMLWINSRSSGETSRLRSPRRARFECSWISSPAGVMQEEGQVDQRGVAALVQGLAVFSRVMRLASVKILVELLDRIADAAIVSGNDDSTRVGRSRSGRRIPG